MVGMVDMEAMVGMEGMVREEAAGAARVRAARGMVGTREAAGALVDMVATMDTVAMATMAVGTTTVVKAEAPMDMVTMDTDMVVETMATMATMVVVATMVAAAEVPLDMVIMDITTRAMVTMSIVAMLDTTIVITRATLSVLSLRLLNWTPVLLISSCIRILAYVSEPLQATDITCELKEQ